MAPYPRWTEEEKRYLSEAWRRRPLEEILAHLLRSEGAVRQLAYKLTGSTLDRPPLRAVRRPAGETPPT